MPDYQKMYTTLFNEISGVIADLQRAQRMTEEMYLATQDNAHVPPALQLVEE